MFAHLMEAPPSLTEARPDLPKDIDEVVATAMAKEREARYSSAGAFASRASVALGQPIDEPSTDRPARRGASRRSRSRRRRRVTIGAVAAVGIMVLVATLLQVVGGGPAEASFKPGIAIVDQMTGEQLAAVPTSRISQPAEAIHANGSFWVHNLDSDSFVEIDHGPEGCSSRSTLPSRRSRVSPSTTGHSGSVVPTPRRSTSASRRRSTSSTSPSGHTAWWSREDPVGSIPSPI